MDDVKITPEVVASTNARKRQQRNHQHRKQSGRHPPTVFARVLVKRCSIGVAFTHELFHALEDDRALFDASQQVCPIRDQSRASVLTQVSESRCFHSVIRCGVLIPGSGFE